MIIIVKFFFYFAIIVSVLSFFIVYANSHPPRYPLSIPPSQFGLKYEDVTFKTADLVDLKGWFIPSLKVRERSPAVIICHGLGANKSDFTDLAGHLARAGFHVLLFDFRAHGESGGSRSSFGHLEKDDLGSAIKYLQTRKEVGPQRIGVYGFSLGAAVAVLAAARHEDIKAVVSDSSFTSLRDQGLNLLKNAYGRPFTPLIYPLMWTYRLYFGVDPESVSPLRSISRISPRPLLIIGGEEDEQMPASDAQRLYAAAGDPKEIWLVPGAVHGGTLGSAGEAYYRRVGAFFSSHLALSR